MIFLNATFILVVDKNCDFLATIKHVYLDFTCDNSYPSKTRTSMERQVCPDDREFTFSVAVLIYDEELPTTVCDSPNRCMIHTYPEYVKYGRHECIAAGDIF